MIITAEVGAYVEIDVEQLVSEIMREYGYSEKSEISNDDIFEYISDHISYLKNRYSDCSSIDVVADGPSIFSLDEKTRSAIMDYINEAN